MLTRGLLLAASFCFCTFANPLPQDPSPTASGDASAQTIVKRLYLDSDTCSDDQKTQIENAWRDAGSLAAAAATFRFDFDYDTPKREWFGKDYNWEGWWPFSSNYKKIINDNIGKASGLHGDVGSGIWIYMSCPKEHKECSPGTIAASADSPGTFWTNHYTIFCPLFFQKDSMTKSIDNVRNNENERSILDNYWGNQGYTFLHETYHYKTTVSYPRAEDYCYQADACWDMAADTHKSTYWAHTNADSFALYSMAIYVQQQLGLPHSPVPRKYTMALTEDTAALNKERADKVREQPDDPEDPNTAPEPAERPYKALDAVPDDLFGTVTVQNLDIGAGAQVPAKWKLLEDISSGPLPDDGGSPPPEETPTDPPAEEPAPLNYAPGTCGFHLHQDWSRAISPDGNSKITINQLVDNDQKKIGYLDQTEIHAETNIDVTSGLPYVLIVTPHDTGEGGESEDRYDFTFAYAGTTWTSRDAEGAAHCSVGPSDHPNWFMFGRNVQDMDCVFPCGPP